MHHGLRGKEADADEEFVRGLARARGLEVLVHRGDARAEAERSRLSPEAAGRSLRYRAFRTWAMEARLDAVALGHNLDDQAETVLLRAVRGAGVRGLAGIPRERRLLRGEPRTRIIRPLLDWTRESILAYLEAAGQGYRIDASNADLSIPRNRIRHEILPLLEGHVHPGARRSLVSIGLAAADFLRDIKVLGRRCFREAVVKADAGGEVRLDVAVLGSWPRAVLHEAFRIAVARAAPGASRGEGAPDVRLPRTALRELERWVAGPPRGARLSFGSRVLEGKRCAFEARYGLIRVRVEDPSRAARPPEDATPLIAGDTAAWGGWRFETAIEEAPAGRPRAAAEAGPGGLVERLDAESLAAAGPLLIRTRREGDRFHPLGASGSKTLKEFFRERQVWPSERGAVPLLAAGDSIAWVVGHRIAHPFRLHAGSRRVLAIRAKLPAGG